MHYITIFISAKGCKNFSKTVGLQRFLNYKLNDTVLTFGVPFHCMVESIKIAIKQIISNIYDQFRDIMKSELFCDSDRAYYSSINMDISDEKAYTSINQLCIYLEKYYEKKAIIHHRVQGAQTNKGADS